MAESGGKTLRAPADSAAVRDRLEEALRLNLIGPEPGHRLAEEELPGWILPSNWYLAGFLVPRSARGRPSDEDADDLGHAEVPESAGTAEESVEEMRAAKRSFFPSSMGLSFLVPGEADGLTVTVSWGEYEKTDAAEAKTREGKPLPVWRRRARAETVSVSLDDAAGTGRTAVPHSGGLVLHVVAHRLPMERRRPRRPAPHRRLPGQSRAAFAGGTRAVSVFLVNERENEPGRPPTEAEIFQAEIRVGCATGFVGRPDPRPEGVGDWDSDVAHLHYADTPEYATGHGVAADWNLDLDGACRVAWTTWIPRAHVERVETAKVRQASLSMKALGEAPDCAAARQMLLPLVREYRVWIEAGSRTARDLDGTRRETAEELLRRSTKAAARIEEGIEVLADDDVFDAFRMANRAVAGALTKRTGLRDPSWRAFQIGFILLNLPSLADPAHRDRETADLLFFPAGGGKTEAYLALAAFAMVLRRLRNPEDGARAGAGVSVVMRYTLRLLTYDQLGRAATLVCALELERGKNPGRYGAWPFEIGLWVGKAATPNQMGRKGERRRDTARAKVKRFKDSGRGSPIPLTTCPWCGKAFKPASFTLSPNADHPRELRIVCSNFRCDFTRDRPLPIVAVDEPLYRRLPALLIATVDKFASLPWVGESGALLGGATHWDKEGFHGAAAGSRPRGRPLARPIPPPDLIIQDELHLISGPLGTATALFETAIDALCAAQAAEGKGPRLIASTATANHAQDQVQAIFAKSPTATFPPPGPTRRDSFFAETDPDPGAARRYLGIAAPGRNPKVVMERVLLTLAGAAQKAFLDGGGTAAASNPADPYMTLLCYFNALRELGGGRRIIEEQVQSTLAGYGARKRVNEERGLFRDRKGAPQVLELTSRVPTHKVAEARARLGLAFREKKAASWAIATNMISVGLDIQRLGLLVVNGQPKTHSEYIQATSRVGRDRLRPGLVVSLLNVHKPRDRSHYERFRHYHETFYRSVEAASATPFAARALDRGLAGALVALARHVDPKLTPALGAGQIAEARDALEAAVTEAFVRRLDEQPIEDEDDRAERASSVRARTRALLDAWRRIRDGLRKDGVDLVYQHYEKTKGGPLLADRLEAVGGDRAAFRVGRSLRDVEPEVLLLLRDLPADGAAAGSDR